MIANVIEEKGSFTSLFENIYPTSHKDKHSTQRTKDPSCAPQVAANL